MYIPICSRLFAPSPPLPPIPVPYLAPPPPPLAAATAAGDALPPVLPRLLARPPRRLHLSQPRLPSVKVHSHFNPAWAASPSPTFFLRVSQRTTSPASPLYSIGHGNGTLLQLLVGSYFLEKLPKDCGLPPCMLVTDEYGWTANMVMVMIMKAHSLRDSNMNSYMLSKKTMDINPENAIMEELRKRSEAHRNDRSVRGLVMLLSEMLCWPLYSSWMIKHFFRENYRMMNLGLNIDEEEAAEGDAEMVEVD